MPRVLNFLCIKTVLDLCLSKGDTVLIDPESQHGVVVRVLGEGDLAKYSSVLREMTPDEAEHFRRIVEVNLR